MKMSYLSLCLPLLGIVAFTPESVATTYAGQACQSRTVGTALSYSTTGASNPSTSTILIACPATHLNDGGTGPADAVIYFLNDGKTKSCFFDNFNIDTGALGVFTSASGTSRLQFPTLNPTLAFQPYAFNCSLPAGSKVTGFYVDE